VLMIVAACMFILGFASTWAPGIWILIGETFPTRTRAKQGALATASNWMWNFFLAFFTPFIINAISYRFGFVFAACNLLGAIVVAMFLYESGGLSLEAVDRMYNDPDVKPWSSRAWANTQRHPESDEVAAQLKRDGEKSKTHGTRETWVEDTADAHTRTSGDLTPPHAAV